MGKKFLKKEGKSSLLNIFNHTLDEHLSGVLQRDPIFSGKIEPEKFLYIGIKLVNIELSLYNK